MSGLTANQIVGRQKQFGLNQLKAKEFSSIRLFFSQFKSPLIYILVLAGLTTLFLKDFADSLIIFAAVFLNTALGFYQEHKAQKALSALRRLLAPKAKVIRDGQEQVIDARELVPGDLVILTIGSRVPADGILTEGTSLTINEAILTGESIPVVKRAGGEAKNNQVFMGTMVVAGIGQMVVEKIGQNTEMGQIGQFVSEAEEEKTPLQLQLAHLASTLALIVGVITVLIFGGGLLRGYPFLEIFTISVAVAVAAIPEGLAMTLTVILALGMQQILKRKAVVRKLVAAETLGSVSTICIDKTGTLTEGELKVVKAQTPNQELLLKAAILCNDRRDPLELAMLIWAEKNSRWKTAALKEEYPRLDEMPFSPETKIVATLHPRLLLVSGAPEIILARCLLSGANSRLWLKKLTAFGQQGYRLVGFAYKQVPTSKTNIQKADLENLEWLGILAYEDPIREGVKEALQECQQAGIKVKVITGDYLPTAGAVLHQLGLDGGKNALTGDQLEKMTLSQLRQQVGSVVLFARTNPQQKLKIVQALKDNGEVVAMMGDGVNDAPALKQADIGIVVNQASDVAKETADMVLLDSNFATIMRAVEEGRRIFENIRKAATYLLSDSFCEIILICGAMILGLPLPVTAAQILWINLAQDTLPAIALAFEPLEKRLMKERPRRREAPFLNAQIKVLVLLIGILTDLVLLFLYWWLSRGALGLLHLQTMMFVALGLNALFIVFACRSLRETVFRQPFFANPMLIYAVTIGFLLLVLAVYLPGLQVLLGTQALGVKEWLLILAVGLFNLLAIETAKYAFLTYDKLKKAC